MNLQIIAAILLVLSLPTLLVVAAVKDYRDHVRRDAERDAEDVKWLAENTSMHRVGFYTKDGEYHVSAYLSSKVFPVWRHTVRMTSRTRATELMEKMYERGFFTDYNDVTYPVAEVTKALVEEFR